MYKKTRQYEWKMASRHKFIRNFIELMDNKLVWSESDVIWLEILTNFFLKKKNCI